MEKVCLENNKSIRDGIRIIKQKIKGFIPFAVKCQIRALLKKYIRAKGRTIPILVDYRAKGRINATHISAFTYGNAGDTLLPVVLRDLFNNTIGIRTWHDEDVHKVVTDNDVKFYNRDDLIVIGGGGLFLKDTCPNEQSGWQWNCSINELLKIKKPIIAFAIGYNRFRGQDEFEPIFSDHINAFVQRAAFIGLRNNGSVEKVKQYLKNRQLREKVVFQPCMTTLISYVYPNYCEYDKKEDFIALNCAFDRQRLRSINDARLVQIAQVMQRLSVNTKLKYFSHMESDLNMLPYLDKAKVPYDVVELKSVKSIVDNYSRARLVIGMRGHSQMIPFGCHTPILSIVSHDKMQWFLDDIHCPQWGVDVLDVNFESQLLSKSLYFYEHYAEMMNIIKAEQKRLWGITLENMECIKTMI